MTSTPDYSDAIGRTERLIQMISADRAVGLAATLDMDCGPADGDPLPPGWHWLYFNPFAQRRNIGADGHPKRGGFLPAVTLPRRMWAGGRLDYHAPLMIGREAEKVSEIISVKAKSGRAGQLVFVTVNHRLSQDGRLCIEEEQDIVYREAAAPGAPKPDPAPAPEGAIRSEQITPDPVLLFRFSALTSNGHRIHYDRTYAREEEDYRDLVVHGPLTATLLQGFVTPAGAGRLIRFEFRGMAPLFGDRPFSVEAGEETEGAVPLWAKGPDGELAMQASAVVEPVS
ncbi:FAS1-like dehydratase domain-containing protein [Qingshengfaniella alkalisoli]|uniref:Acyl-CoA dehydrogenase n=1 Tax=Qingshengfaniella alkalisoli TaxID=2599296 RepID=A0A5B8ICS3_9RHOB|nr:MaoC family dehydratase N-terminal domain-containing protein [Qingshengfaniella alkalisoli]QDY71386.1 acyl-CoA dehydrogenase [Qingshengfaniella alkalisoli]